MTPSHVQLYMHSTMYCLNAFARLQRPPRNIEYFDHQISGSNDCSHKHRNGLVGTSCIWIKQFKRYDIGRFIVHSGVHAIHPCQDVVVVRPFACYLNQASKIWRVIILSSRRVLSDEFAINVSNIE
jgi:hypothetical protein